MDAKTPSMAGTVCLVTGTTSGIGKEAARGLAKLGATVVAVARDKQRGEAMVQELIQTSGNKNVELLLCDLSLTSSIKKAVEELKRTHDRLHVLINQAGLFTSERQVTSEGMEMTFAVNHMAYFTLTVLLLDVLKASAPSRIIFGTGDMYAAGNIDFDDLQAEKKFNPLKAVAQSKLGNVDLMDELARRLEGTGVTVNSFEPGAVKTNLGVGQRGPFAWLMGFARMIGSSPEEAGKIPVYLASAPELEKVTAKYFSHKLKMSEASPKAMDPALGRRLWDVSAKLAGIPA